MSMGFGIARKPAGKFVKNFHFPLNEKINKIMYEIACKNHKIRYNITILEMMKERGDCLLTANRIMKKPDVDRAFPDVPDEDVRSFFAALEWM